MENNKVFKVTINRMNPEVWKVARKGAIDDGENVDKWVEKAIMYYYHRQVRIDNLPELRRVMLEKVGEYKG